MITREAGPAVRSPDVEAAQAIILRHAVRGSAETVPLAEAAGRTLAVAIEAAEDLWPFPRAAMDGIAVRSAAVLGASPERPVRLRVGATVYAGGSAAPLPEGACARVATGAPMPTGADAVIPQEALLFEGGDALVASPVSSGRNVFPPGEDVRAGERVLEPGTVLTGGHVSLLAAMGFGRVSVVGRPTVAILACGDELIDPGESLRPGLVRESNSFGLAAAVGAVGAMPVRLDTARDTHGDLDARVAEGLEADVLITCGGASVGERDLVRTALRRAGMTLLFEGVAMKPGAPASFGVAGRRLVFALPGTPSACRVAFEILTVPALRSLLGRSPVIPPAISARLSAPLRVKAGRRRYLWGLATWNRDGLWVSPHRAQSTAALRAASDANALIALDGQAGDLPAGAGVAVHLLGFDLPSRHAEAGGIRPAPVLGVVGAKGAGKTKLLERLIPALARRGVTVTVVKHDAHLHTLDQQGRDTARMAAAGASRTILVGPAGIITRAAGRSAPRLDEALAHAGDVDLILVEGFGQAAIPKILVRSEGVTSDKAPPAEPIIATVGDQDDPTREGARGQAQSRPWFSWAEMERLADFLADLASRR